MRCVHAPVRECVTYVSQQAVGETSRKGLYSENKYLQGGNVGGAEGGRTPDLETASLARSQLRHSREPKAQHFRRLTRTTQSHGNHNSKDPMTKHDPVSHQKCVTCVSQPEDLAYVVKHWDALPNSVKADIRATVERAER